VEQVKQHACFRLTVIMLYEYFVNTRVVLLKLADEAYLQVRKKTRKTLAGTMPGVASRRKPNFLT
jgi:hypothetical protein